MNDLKELKNKYKNKTVNKQTYIKKMFAIHNTLFNYSEFLNGTDISKIEIEDNFLVFTSRKNLIKILCRRRDRRVAPIEILNFDQYEERDLPMMTKLIDRNMQVFDVGANVGWVTLNIWKEKKGVKISAFEPVSETFPELLENLKINNARNVKPFNFGFSDSNKKVYFYLSPHQSVSASSSNLSPREKVKKVRGELRKMDDFTFRQRMRVDFIKCDVEGAEFFVIKGGIRTIKKYSPIIFLEMLRKWSKKFNYSPNEIIKLLNKLGYSCFVCENDRLLNFTKMDGKTTYTNFFFLHRERHRKKILENGGSLL